MDKPVKQGGKKPYTPPILTVYGTIRELTQAVGCSQRGESGIPCLRRPENG